MPDWQGWLRSHKHLRASSLHLYSKFSYSLCVYHSCIERMKLKKLLPETKWKNLTNNKAKKNKYIVVALHRYRFDAADFLHSRGSWWPDDVRSFVQTIVTQLLQSESCLIARKIGACHHDVSAKFYLFLCIVGWCNLFTPQIIFAVFTQRFLPTLHKVSENCHALRTQSHCGALCGLIDTDMMNEWLQFGLW